MTDRRRINGPSGGTRPPVFSSTVDAPSTLVRPQRARDPDQLRKIFLQTGLTPSASGSAYLELEPSSSPPTTLIRNSSSLKLTCTVHGPRPLPRSAPFSPQLILSAHVKYTPFASRQRRGYIRDSGERDLSAHLETALRSVIIGDRWPKSGVEVVVTILEGEEDAWWGERHAGRDGGIGGWGMMSVLAGCITVASAAIVEAGIDCVDLVSGGMAALVRQPFPSGQGRAGEEEQTCIVLDPCPAEHEVLAACVVGYLAASDELVEIWMHGSIGTEPDLLVNKAVEAATASRSVLAAALREATEMRVAASKEKKPGTTGSEVKE